MRFFVFTESQKIAWSHGSSKTKMTHGRVEMHKTWNLRPPPSSSSSSSSSSPSSSLATMNAMLGRNLKITKRKTQIQQLYPSNGKLIFRTCHQRRQMFASMLFLDLSNPLLNFFWPLFAIPRRRLPSQPVSSLSGSQTHLIRRLLLLLLTCCRRCRWWFKLFEFSNKSMTFILGCFQK